MSSSLIQSLSVGATFDQSFVQSTTAIENYCSWIADQSDTGNSSLDAILTKCKTDAIAWYNSIYPTYLNMPTTIASSGQTIDSDLSTLISLSQQLQSNNTPQIRQAIAQYAQDLEQTIQGLATQTAALAQSLTVFSQNIMSDSQSYNSGMGIINQQLSSLNVQLSGLYGQLHSLQSATCPNQGDINACQQQIDSVTSTMNQYEGFGQLFNTGLQESSEAAYAASYLAQFWVSFTSDAQNVTASLQNIQNAPASIVQIELEQVQQRWNNLKSQLQQAGQSTVS